MRPETGHAKRLAGGTAPNRIKEQFSGPDAITTADFPLRYARLTSITVLFGVLRPPRGHGRYFGNRYGITLRYPSR